jgi:hypothetical protein
MPPLPDWAPENPSPEFIRAARVLKPLPIEELLGGDQGGQGMAAMAESMKRFWPTLYEFFGTLSDEQTERFLSSSEEQPKILIPVKSLTAKQRVALENFFGVYRESVKGSLPQELQGMDDYRVMLYKMGAREDLSNVQVGVVAQGGHAVHILFCITRSDDSQDGSCTAFAQI